MSLQNNRRLWVLMSVFLFLLVAGLYAPSLYYGFAPVDDSNLILENAAVHGMNLKNLWAVFTTYDPELYVPLTMITFQIEHALFGEFPLFYHLTNIILHALNALLVLWCVQLLTKNRLIAFITALLFAIHPIHSEAVLWISARKDLLSSFFFLLSVGSYLRYKLDAGRWYILSIVFFLCALLSKISVFPLPVILLLIDYYRDGAKGNAMLKDKWPYFYLALFFLIVGMFGKSLSVYVLPYFSVFLLSCKGIAFYLSQFLAPSSLSFLYPYTAEISLFSPDIFVSVLITGAAFLIAWRAKFIDRRIFFGLFWFFFMLFPSIANNARMKVDYVFFASDRYVYLASVGIFFLMAYGFVALVSHFRSHLIRAVMTAAVSLYIISIVSVALTRVFVWQTSETLLLDAVQRYPDAHVAYSILGRTAMREDRYNNAIPYLEQAIALRPDDYKSTAFLALALLRLDDEERGRALIAEVRSKAPDAYYGNLYQSLIYIADGDYGSAKDLLLQMAEATPKKPDVHQLLGSIYEHEHDLIRAEEAYRLAIELNPLSARPKAALARMMRLEE